jgi:transcription elongation factor GreB
MGRGFVIGDDQEEVPVVPQRAYLPDGTTNYVTPFHMNQLLAEKLMPVTEKNDLNNTSENEKQIALNYVNAKLKLLNNRIVEARIIDPNG